MIDIDYVPASGIYLPDSGRYARKESARTVALYLTHASLMLVSVSILTSLLLISMVTTGLPTLISAYPRHVSARYLRHELKLPWLI